LEEEKVNLENKTAVKNSKPQVMLFMKKLDLTEKNRKMKD